MSYGYIPEGDYADWARALDKREAARRKRRNRINPFDSGRVHGIRLGDLPPGVGIEQLTPEHLKTMGYMDQDGNTVHAKYYDYRDDEPPTPCCNASLKGVTWSRTGLCCRACYKPMAYDHRLDRLPFFDRLTPSLREGGRGIETPLLPLR